VLKRKTPFSPYGSDFQGNPDKFLFGFEVPYATLLDIWGKHHSYGEILLSACTASSYVPKITSRFTSRGG
jgi:hypothetical protein